VVRVRCTTFLVCCAFAGGAPSAWGEPPTPAAAEPQPAAPPTAAPPENSANAPKPPPVDRGGFLGLWVAPWATDHFQGAGWDGGYHDRWIAGQYRVGFLQNGYEPVSGTPLLTLDRTQRLLLDLEVDLRWRFSKVQTLVLGGGIGIIDDYVDTTSMSGLAWSTTSVDQWHVRPLAALTLTSLLFRATAAVYLGSTPQAVASLGVYWGKR
jgi:hypothetical protein